MTFDALSLHKDDKEALAILEKAIGNSPLPIVSHIDHKTTEIGIQIENNRIIGLSLVKCGLNSIPNIIVRLKTLKILNLSENNLDSADLLILRELPALTHLYLTDNPTLELHPGASYILTKEHLLFYLEQHLIHPLTRHFIHKSTLKTILEPEGGTETQTLVSQILNPTTLLTKPDIESFLTQSQIPLSLEAKDVIITLFDEISTKAIRKNTIAKALWFFQTEPLPELKALIARLYREMPNDFVKLSKLAPFHPELQKITDQERDTLIKAHLEGTLRWTAAYFCPDLKLPLNPTSDSPDIHQIIDQFLTLLTNATKMRVDDLDDFQLRSPSKISLLNRFRDEPCNGIQLYSYIIGLLHPLGSYLTDETKNQQICSQLLKLCFHHPNLRHLAENALKTLSLSLYEKVKVIRELEDAIDAPLHLIADIEDLSGGEKVIEIRDTQIYAIRILNTELSTLPAEIQKLNELVHLDLRKLGLTELPSTIGELSHLKYLWLNGNQLKTLPESFGKLEDLHQLDLSGNKLQSLPESIGNLLTLIELNLQDNVLTAVDIPESIGNLFNLQKLVLNRNRFGSQLESFPESFSNLLGLSELDLSENMLNSLSDSISKLPNLQTLDLRWNQLSDLPESFGQLSTLKHLYLGYNRMQLISDASFDNLTNLQTLGLANNQLTTLPDSLGGLQNLEILEIHHNKLQSLPDAIFINLSNLQVLDLSNNELKSIPLTLEQLQHLKTLILSYNKDFNSLPTYFTKLKALKTLDVSHTSLAASLLARENALHIVPLTCKIIMRSPEVT